MWWGIGDLKSENWKNRNDSSKIEILFFSLPVKKLMRTSKGRAGYAKTFLFDQTAFSSTSLRVERTKTENIFKNQHYANN